MVWKQDARGLNDFLHILLNLEMQRSQVEHIYLFCAWSPHMSHVWMTNCLCIKGKHSKLCLSWDILKTMVDIRLNVCEPWRSFAIFVLFHQFNIQSKLCQKRLILSQVS